VTGPAIQNQRRPQSPGLHQQQQRVSGSYHSPVATTCRFERIMPSTSSTMKPVAYPQEAVEPSNVRTLLIRMETTAGTKTGRHFNNHGEHPGKYQQGQAEHTRNDTGKRALPSSVCGHSNPPRDNSLISIPYRVGYLYPFKPFILE
jgi:hypothetical protein